MQERAAIEISLAEEVLRSYGKLRILARGSSMIPTIFPGDVLLVEHSLCQRLRPGDVVLAQRDGRFFAHRVVRLTALGGSPRVITCGDALSEEDPAFFHGEILGRVTSMVRGDKWIPLAGDEDLKGKHLLQWAVRHSQIITAGILWLYSRLNLRLNRGGQPTGDRRARIPGKLAECS
ncbi:MAG TPA: S24/S26 family peptidase [Candidatus Aquilonibacter sp.]|nr:S24/S26 family peptidase [Candidatus Aquilonibacter sp.]